MNAINPMPMQTAPLAGIYISSPFRSSQEMKVVRACWKVEAPDWAVVKDDAELHAILISATLTSADPLEVRFESPEAYQCLRRVWRTMVRKVSHRLILRLRPGNSPEIIMQPAFWLIDLVGTPEVDLQNRLTFLTRYAVDGLAVLTANTPLYWPEVVKVLTLCREPAEILMRETETVKLDRASRIVFLLRTGVELHTRIPRAFWKRLFARALPEVLELSKCAGLRPLRLFADSKPTTLFVFPERMLPVERAYYLRAFDVLLGLAYGGQPTAVMVLGPANNDLERIRSLLSIFSSSVTARPLVRGRRSLSHWLLLRAESLFRRLAGLTGSAPLRYTERGMLFATPENSELLSSVIDTLPDLRNVVYTGAWFGRAIRRVARKRPDLRWICDTHDVFFVLDSSNDSAENRHYFYSASSQRRLELKELSYADIILAISPSDHAAMSGAGLNRPILVEPGSFTHVENKTSVCEADRLMCFGFIGSNNCNNLKCLEIIQRTWWPTIIAERPDARLELAGAICRSDVALRLAETFPESVRLLGFVDSLESYYSTVGTMLSPIAVQGGLNFKSVEALMAGCFLLTNDIGIRCLGDSMDGVTVVGKNGEGLKRFLVALTQEVDMPARREELRAVANQRYGDEVAYSSLLSVISANSLPVRDGNHP